MSLKIDHVGVAVKDLSRAIRLWRDVLGLDFHGEEEIPSDGVKTAFFRIGETDVELLEPTAPTSPVAKFLEKRGEGIHHLALAVQGIEQVLSRMKSAGVDLVDAAPRPGAHGKRVAFLHPRSTGGILLELCERAPEGAGGHS